MKYDGKKYTKIENSNYSTIALGSFTNRSRPTFSETQRRAQETEAHAQETGRKLQVLMEAVNSSSGGTQSSGLCPIPPDATTFVSQRTVFAQKQLEWHGWSFLSTF